MSYPNPIVIPLVSKKHTKPFRHLTPLEVHSIKAALKTGARVVNLARQYKVTRQTIYNAKNETENSSEDDNHDAPLPAKRKRERRVNPQVRDKVIALRKKYPSWGAAYLREELRREKFPPTSIATIYKVLRDANLNGRGVPPKVYERFTMKRPGQLYQVDIQGKIWIPRVGWIHGHAVLDDYSRYPPAFTYFSDTKANNIILTLHRAIEASGVPEAVYVDNGTQFCSRGERMSNFELFCSAHGIQVVTSTPYRPQGKGKVERFFGTVERQFIPEARAKAETDPTYNLSKLNADLQLYLRDRYNARVHSATKQVPLERFSERVLRRPTGPISVTPFLDREKTRTVNHHGEISYKGYVVQVALPVRSKVTVVESLETLQIEYQEQVIRQVNKQDLQKVSPVKIQDGVAPKNLHASQQKQPNAGPSATSKYFLEGGNGYCSRKVTPEGIIEYNGRNYPMGTAWAGQGVFVAGGENEITVLDVAKNFIKNIPHWDSTQSSSPLPKKQSLVERVRICPVPIDLKDPARKIYRRKISSNGHLHVRGRTYFQDDIRATFVRGEVLITQDEDKLYIFDAKENYLVYEPLFYRIKTNGRGDFFFYHYIFSLGEQWSQTLVYLTFGCHSMWVYNEEKVFITMVAFRDAFAAEKRPDNFYDL